MAGVACGGLYCVWFGKMSKVIGMTIRKSVVVQLLFWDSIPICSFIFLNAVETCFCCLFRGRKPWIVVVA